MAQHYSNQREDDPKALPDIETFYIDDRTAQENCQLCGAAGIADCASDFPSTVLEHAQHVGWYWWTCLPGCLPDGEASGPFDTEEEALQDARDSSEL